MLALSLFLAGAVCGGVLAASPLVLYILGRSKLDSLARKATMALGKLYLSEVSRAQEATRIAEAAIGQANATIASVREEAKMYGLCEGRRFDA